MVSKNKSQYPKIGATLDEIVIKINSKLGSVLSSPQIIPSLKSFVGKYLSCEIKREEITLIHQIDHMYIIKIEYFTTIVPINKDLNFDDSYSNHQMRMENKQKTLEDIDESQNINEDENTIVMDSKSRPTFDREFFKKILVSLAANKKIVVQDVSRKEAFYSTVIRLVAFNSKFYWVIFLDANFDANVLLRVERKNENEGFNEYIPTSYTSTKVSATSYKNVFVVSKLIPQENWTDNFDMDFKTKVEWMQYRATGYQSDYSHYS